MSRVRIRLWTVFVALFIDAAFGALWYSSALFGDSWHQLQGLDAAALSQRGWVHGVSMLVNLLKVASLATLIVWTRATGWQAGLRVGLLVWVGFVVTIWTGSTLYADRSLEVLAINMGFHLVAISAMAALIGRFARTE